MKSEQIKNWMEQEFITVSPDTPAVEVFKLMHREGVDYAPIVDTETNHLLGVVTEKDIYHYEAIQAPVYDVWKAKHNPHYARLPFFMPPSPLTISVNDNVGHAARMMVQNGITVLPIVDDNELLVGMITQAQIFRMIILYEWGSGRVPTEANLVRVQTGSLARS